MATTARAIRAHRRQLERDLVPSFAEWQAKKLAEWEAVMTALESFTIGSAYTPAGRDLVDLQRLAEEIDDAMGGVWVGW